MNHTILKIANVVLVLGTLVGIIWPAFIEGQGFSAVVHVYLQPDWSQGFVMRWLIAIFFFLSLYVVVIEKIYRRIPLTVISTKLEVVFHAPDGSLAEINRTQLLRANRRHVTAYYSVHRPSSAGGSMPLNEMSHSTYCEHCDLADNIEVHGNDSKGYEITHVFGKPLPFSEYMPLIPLRFLDKDYEKLPNFLQKNLVVRRQTIQYKNEFNVDRPIMVLSAVNYTQMNVQITLKFCHSIPQTLRVRRVQNVGMTDINPERHTEQKLVRFRIRKFANEKIRISWDPIDNLSMASLGVGGNENNSLLTSPEPTPSIPPQAELPARARPA